MHYNLIHRMFEFGLQHLKKQTVPETSTHPDIPLGLCQSIG